MALLRCAALMLLFPLAAAAPGHAADGVQMIEQKIKAALIYNLLKYVDWPQDVASAPTAVVCIFGDDPFAGSLEPLGRRTVNQRQIALRRIREIADAGSCQLLFINANERAHWPELSAFLADKSVLTVSDFDSFAGSGGMVEFRREGEHIGVSIDMVAVTAARLRIQDRLLNLAHVIPAAPH